MGKLHSLLLCYLEQVGGAYPMFSPSDVWRDDRKYNRLQPDIFVVRLGLDKAPAYPFHIHALLLAIEIVSPSNPRLDYDVKRERYLWRERH